jgi:NDP-sugar pyrophosphorylase family protein
VEALLNAILLAAGRGTRLRPVEPDVPKALVEISGEPLLARQLRYLQGQGISRVVVNAHYLADQVVAFAAEHRGSPELHVVVEKELLGTAGGVRNALPALGDDRFVVLYGDVLTNEPLAPLAERHRRSGALATLAVYESAEIEGKGTITVDDAGMVLAFMEKSAAAIGGTALINAGIYIVEPAFARQIPEHVPSDFGHDVFPAALVRGQRLATHRLSSPVLDVGIPATLELARLGRQFE